ncbi:MAG: aminodeoxychorismate lyase [Gammaproteobacteria bacterium]|nr:aminodeoxychorismate lyase [Gammaproteobacteria bacterium]
MNGEISSQVSVADRGLQFGDGLFETIAVIGGQPRFWQGHMDRLSAGCERLGIPATPQAVLLRELNTVSAGNPHCVVRILLTRGLSAMDFSVVNPAAATRIVSSHAWPLQEADFATLGIRARICHLRLGIQPELGGLNHLNRLEQVRARTEWQDASIWEGILLDREDHIISGIASNIFLVLSGRLLTPRLDRCGVRGVMREAILSAFRPRCEQRRLMLDMLPEAQEIFVCNSIEGILPVTRIDHWEYDIGPVTREVQDWLSQQ